MHSSSYILQCSYEWVLASESWLHWYSLQNERSYYHWWKRLRSDTIMHLVHSSRRVRARNLVDSFHMTPNREKAWTEAIPLQWCQQKHKNTSEENDKPGIEDPLDNTLKVLRKKIKKLTCKKSSELQFTKQRSTTTLDSPSDPICIRSPQPIIFLLPTPKLPITYTQSTV